MATIRVRKLTDGSVRYTAQIRIKREGVQVYQESQTFARKQAAQAWARKRESELDEPGAIVRVIAMSSGFDAHLKDVTSGDLSHLVIVENDHPTAVLIDINTYQSMLDELEDLRSELLAIERLSGLDDSLTVSLEEMEGRF